MEDTFLWGKRLIQWKNYNNATVIASKNEKGSLKAKWDHLQSMAKGSVRLKVHFTMDWKINPNLELLCEDRKSPNFKEIEDSL